jgi:ABC-2 type transport system ATP-binding protein
LVAARRAVSTPPPDPTARLDGDEHLLGRGLADQAAWAPDGPVVLATHALHKQYDVPAVDGVDLRVPAGSTYGLIGPNGSGKTTLLSMVAGLRTPTSGTIDLEVARTRMALLADTPEFEPWLTAREVVDLSRHLVAPDLGPDAVEAALVEVGLEGAADRRVGGFSRGMLQRVGLATCLVGDPQLLLLDEPSSALDPAGRREVLDLIARLAGERTVVLSTHVLTDVQQACDIVGVLQHGRLVFQGPLDVLLAHTDAVYRLRVTGPPTRWPPLCERSRGWPTWPWRDPAPCGCGSPTSPLPSVTSQACSIASAPGCMRSVRPPTWSPRSWH